MGIGYSHPETGDSDGGRGTAAAPTTADTEVHILADFVHRTADAGGKATSGLAAD